MTSRVSLREEAEAIRREIIDVALETVAVLTDLPKEKLFDPPLRDWWPGFWREASRLSALHGAPLTAARAARWAAARCENRSFGGEPRRAALLPLIRRWRLILSSPHSRAGAPMSSALAHWLAGAQKKYRRSR